MNRTTKWLVGLVALLVVANIALVATILLKKDEVNKQPLFKGDARDYLISNLSLDGVQIKRFDSLRQEHFKRINDYQTTMRFLKDRLFGLLRENDTNRIRTQIKDYLQQKIGDVQANIDLETFHHFYQLRSFLNEQQRQKFDNTIQEVLRTLAPGGLRPPRPGGGMQNPDDRRGPPPGEGPDGPPH